jgi:hypothetical protein
VPSAGDGTPVELGVRFRADVSGSIVGLRFYKGAGNDGTHVGSLWTGSGALLARATFTEESASGWQRVLFPAPVSVLADTTYVASYHAPLGRYSVTIGGFASPVVLAPLVGLADGADGGNGIFAYTPTPAFPTQAFSASNYWLDVLFVPDP